MVAQGRIAAWVWVASREWSAGPGVAGCRGGSGWVVLRWRVAVEGWWVARQRLAEEWRCLVGGGGQRRHGGGRAGGERAVVPVLVGVITGGVAGRARVRRDRVVWARVVVVARVAVMGLGRCRVGRARAGAVQVAGRLGAVVAVDVSVAFGTWVART